MRLGLYGGTFDPIHNAHLHVAEAAYKAFALDKVLLIPNKQPPHKESATSAGFEDRLRMVELVCRERSWLEACGIENHEGKSYTIQTLNRLRIQYGAGAKFFFIIGADAFAEVMTWYRVKEVFEMTEFIVADRPGFAYEIPAGARVQRLAGTAWDESSTAVRNQLACGETATELNPRVAEYIKTHGLYRVAGRAGIA